MEPYFILKLQTDGTITPTQAFRTACDLLLDTITKLQGEFKREFDFKAMDEDDTNQTSAAARVGGTGPYGDPYGSTTTTAGQRMRAHDYADF